MEHKLKVEYLSESNPDFKCLEDYLKSGLFGELQDLNSYLAQVDPKIFMPIFESLNKNTPNHLKSDSSVKDIYSKKIVLPTRFESPLNYHLLQGKIQKIKNTATQIGLDVSSFPHSSSIPTGLVNARALDLQCSNQKFILFDSQLFTFCNLFAKCFSLLLPVKSVKGQSVALSFKKADAIEHLKTNIDGITRLLDLMQSYCVEKTISKAKQYFIQEKYESITEVLRSGMELFVVGHEFGHVYSGHLNRIKKQAYLNCIDFSNQQIPENHYKEHQADILGMILTVEAQINKGYDVYLAYSGVDLFMSSLDLVEKYSYFLVHKTDEGFKSSASATHPSIQTRKRLLRNAVMSIGSSNSSIDYLAKYLNEIDTILDLAWSKCKSTLNKSII